MTRVYKAFLMELIDRRALELVDENGELDEGSVGELLEELDDHLLAHIDTPALIRTAPALVDVLLWETLPLRPWLTMMECRSRPSVGAALAWVITDSVERAALKELAGEVPKGISLRVVQTLVRHTERPPMRWN